MLWALVAIAASGQERKYCVRDDGRALTRGLIETSSVSALEGEWHVPVIFVAFQDVDFSTPGITAKWDAMLNQTGFSENGAAGCVSDYFMIQSGGKFKLHFDVFGPVTVSQDMKYYGRNIGSDDADPEAMIVEACQLIETDLAPYDWDGDGTVDVVLVVYAGYGENRSGTKDAIWPHKWNIFGEKVGDLSLYSYACVSELDGRGVMDGYGTFVHEFSHCLGLPDLYPSSVDLYSYFDEWDLMDGGNYSNHSWSIPHYSAFERYVCHWLDYTELTSATTITDMLSFDEEALAYVIRNDEDPEEYYILENRQQRGFDSYVPGNGLLITHVDHYDGSLFPNGSPNRPQVKLVTADNRTYRESEAYFGTTNKYTEDGHNRYLSLAAYPFVDEETVNDHLSPSSTPAMTFAKPVSSITMNDGKISFDFLKEETAIRSVQKDEAQDTWYDLQGRRLQGRPTHKGLYIHNGKKELILFILSSNFTSVPED